MKATKQCAGPCGRTLALDRFGRQADRKGGRSWCRECRRLERPTAARRTFERTVAEKIVTRLEGTT